MLVGVLRSCCRAELDQYTLLRTHSYVIHNQIGNRICPAHLWERSKWHSEALSQSLNTLIGISTSEGK